MSAWICSPVHIATLANFIDPERRQEVAAVLALENVRSVQYRYPDHPVEEMLRGGAETVSEYIASCMSTNPSEKYSDPRHLPKIAGCYDYQSCDHPGYEGSLAQRWVATHADGEYCDDTPWGIEEDNQ